MVHPVHANDNVDTEEDLGMDVHRLIIGEVVQIVIPRNRLVVLEAVGALAKVEGEGSCEVMMDMTTVWIMKITSIVAVK